MGSIRALRGRGGERRLSEPAVARRRRPDLDGEGLGRFAERLTRVLGSGGFVVGQTCVVAGWLGLNVAGWRWSWDPRPFYGLNLIFSIQAAYAAPLILLAQRRQAGRDREQADLDRTVRAQAHAEADFVTREVAAVRIELAEAACRSDLDEAIGSLLRQVDAAATRAERADRAAVDVERMPLQPASRRCPPGDRGQPGETRFTVG